MSNKVKYMDIKSFFNDTINVKNFDLNNIKVDEKSYENISIYYTGYVTIEDLKGTKINNVNLSYLIFSKMNKYFEEINKNKWLTLASTNESKEKILKNEELLNKIRNLIRSITSNSDDYDEKCMKIKFDLDDEIPLNTFLAW